ncbi:acetate uptake transporter [Jatrophihabitans endophyticus]|uniref:acetate uptake transporter n=1 Tax=Jatrophihabitans endophyticus TaxID=1206085 RepID=UPI001A01679D|nr:acetate uptake transporter [Jatrophihabitans endophyticus]MBE7189159.1 acetate uptake transporter [Jatrophihabitans endophyticus]
MSQSTDPTSEHRPSPTASPGFGSRISDPGPLGLAGFAGTTLFLSCVNAGLLPAGVTAGVFGLAIFYGGIAQLLAGLWEFTKGNTFGSTAFVSYGAFWLSFWFLNTHTTFEGSPSDINHAVGTYLLVWTIFTAYMFIASLRTTGAIAAVFLALALTFLFLTIGKYGDSSGITKVGGYIGLVTAALAFYGSFAAVTNETFKKTVLPVVPLAR